jgi:hypothetical protein
MKKMGLFGAVLIIFVLATAFVLAEATTLDDTKVDYLSYREIAEGQPGLVYQIKITNTGSSNRTYELIPDTEITRQMGSYRIDPASKITISPGSEETFNFFISVEKPVYVRQTIPLEIKSGSSSITINLVARLIGPFEKTKPANMFESAVKIIFYTLLVILLLILIMRLFGRRKKEEPGNKNEKDPSSKDENEVETYY